MILGFFGIVDFVVFVFNKQENFYTHANIFPPNQSLLQKS